MNLKEIEKVVASIQTELFRNSNSFSVGMLKSHFKGAGLQFKEHQVYNPGDDVRFIDWKLSAKTTTTMVKTFEEERNVEIHILLDLADTMLMGYKGISKLQASIEIICLIFLLAHKSKDRVSVIVSGETITILPLASGHEGIVILISQLEKMKILNVNGKVNLNYKFKDNSNVKSKMGILKSLVARGKEVIIFSDLGSFGDMETLNKLLYRPNLHCFVIQSPLDYAKKLPFVVFGQSKHKIRAIRVNQLGEPDALKGRFKNINVKDRYLEKFIREML